MPVDLGVEGDNDEGALASALSSALHNNICDVPITTGGISVGENDTLERVLVERIDAKVICGRMHMKPAKPTTFDDGGRARLSGDSEQHQRNQWGRIRHW